MSTRIRPDHAPAGLGLYEAIGGDPRMAVEIEYRMARLRTEAEDERLARTLRRRSPARLWLGRALVTLGRLVEGAGPREEERGSPVRA